MGQLQSISADTSADSAMEILERDGAVIYERVLDDAVMDRIQTELDPYLKRSYLGEGEFWGYKTKRISSLVAKSRTFAEKVAINPVTLAVMDQLLGPHCERYQLHVTQVVQVVVGGDRFAFGGYLDVLVTHVVPWIIVVPELARIIHQNRGETSALKKNSRTGSG